MSDNWLSPDLFVARANVEQLLAQINLEISGLGQPAGRWIGDFLGFPNPAASSPAVTGVAPTSTG